MNKLLLALLAVGASVAVLLSQTTSSQPPPPVRGSASVRWEPWSAMRSAATAILGWKIGATAEDFPGLSFYDAVAQIDREGVGYFEGVSAQQFNEEIPKGVNDDLQPGERNAMKDRLTALNLAMAAYHVPNIPAEQEVARKLFDFAKQLGVETLVPGATPASLPAVDKLANEYGISVALPNIDIPEGLGSRIGVCGDLAQWRKSGLDPLETIKRLNSRLLVLNMQSDAPGLAAILREMYRLQLKPSLITVSGGLEAFEKALQPVLADKVDQISRTAPIRSPDSLTAETRSQIDAALPSKAVATPKKPRKLLVLDLNVAYPGHRSIPAENYALEQMGKRTGAYEAVFSNDLDNLKYDRIRQFDAVYLNNTVGMIFVDPEVREGLTRFVREGGGLGGNHGTSHASMDWPEFHEMIGVVRGIHRENTEKAWIKIDDRASRLTVPFQGKEFLYMDEFFRFPTPPYSRDKLHVLLSIDVEKTDMNQGRPCQWPCVRPDHDYAVSWIRDYGKGRVFFAILGHQPTLFTTPALADYFFRGIQFILGDLDADATPSARLRLARNGSSQ